MAASNWGLRSARSIRGPTESEADMGVTRTAGTCLSPLSPDWLEREGKPCMSDTLDTLLTFLSPMVSSKKLRMASLLALEGGDKEGVDAGEGLLGGVRIIFGDLRLMLNIPDMQHVS